MNELIAARIEYRLGELSEAIPKVSQIPNAVDRVVQSSQWLSTGPDSRWNIFLNDMYTDTSQPVPIPNFVAEEVVVKNKEGSLRIPEYITLYAVGLLGMARVLNTALASSREQLLPDEIHYYQAIVSDNRSMLQKFEKVNLTIHGDPCHWALEFAQDEANFLIKQGLNQQSLEVIENALLRYPLRPPLSSWNLLAGNAAKGVLLARKGQAEMQIEPALKGLLTLLSIYPKYKNVDRILALVKIIGNISAQSIDPTLSGSDQHARR